MPKENFAARAGAWSAAHRKTAIFGWLGFVLLAGRSARAAFQADPPAPNIEHSPAPEREPVLHR
jgi:hypothetical protein